MASDFRNRPSPFGPAMDTFRSTEFDDGIFDRILPPGEPSTDGDDPEDVEPPSQREGLPPGFRMRHDPHYVEALISGNLGDGKLAAALAPAPTPSAKDEPTNGHRVAAIARPSVHSTAKACAEIGPSLDAIGACLGLFGPTSRPASERAALELIGAEVFRATTLLRAFAVLDEELAVGNVPLNAASLVARVVAGLGSGHTVSAALDTVPSARVRGDEGLLTTALAGAVMALQALTERVSGARIEIGGREEHGRVVIAVAQDAVRIPAAWHERFFDAGWADRPGGSRIAVVLAAARRVADLHGGTLALDEIEHGGCRLVLSLPRF